MSYAALSECERYGVRGTFRALIKSGVSQSSILSPLLFLLYINYLPTVTAKNAKLVLVVGQLSSQTRPCVLAVAPLDKGLNMV